MVFKHIDGGSTTVLNDENIEHILIQLVLSDDAT